MIARKWWIVMLATGVLSSGIAYATDFGRQSYLLNCAGCHGPDGTGSDANEVPTLHRIPGQFVKVPRGRAFLSQVPGIVYSSLTNAEVAEILNWILIHYSSDVLSADFKPYTVSEVARYRGVHPVSIPKIRAQVLSDLAAQGISIDYGAR